MKILVHDAMRTTVLTLVAVLAPQVVAMSAPTDQEPSSEVMALMQEGSAYFLRDDFKKAIGPYQKALDLEKVKRTLNKSLWRVLVDNLGMSYGITGDLKSAKQTFEYGISKEPDYPMFYYNMACTYGELDNVDKAIEYLKLAFERRDNMIAGEKMPDPATDSSFARFIDDPKFKAALKEIKNK